MAGDSQANRAMKGLWSRDEGTIVTCVGVAKVRVLTLALATRVKRLVFAVSRTVATTGMFGGSNDDRDTGQDRAGMGRIL